ncbi:MAG: hypothetical protein U5L01_16505 [Rheinheimera sp.]|nr:hypothetical protein [Rheinheimera sp.]
MFYQAALEVATVEQPALVVTGGNFTGELASTDAVTVLKSLPNQQLMTLIAHAGLVVSGGGDMMGQAIVLGKTIVAVPVAKDQPDRVFACAAEGLIHPATLAKADIVAQCRKAALHQAYQANYSNRVYSLRLLIFGGCCALPVAN